MQIDLTTIIALAIPFTTGLIWLVRLEGRVNTSDARFADLKVDLVELKSDMKALLKR